MPSAANTSGTGVADYFKSYSTANPCVKVVRQGDVVTGDAAYLTHVLSQFSSGSEPNLLMFDNPELAEFAADNVLIPLSSLGTFSVVSKLNPANVAETTYNGKLYALPLCTNTEAIFYNKTLVQQNGITTLPTTWAAVRRRREEDRPRERPRFSFLRPGRARAGEGELEPFSWTNGGSMEVPLAAPARCRPSASSLAS